MGETGDLQWKTVLQYVAIQSKIGDTWQEL